MTRIVAALAAIAVIATSQLLTPSPAEAHERRTVGPYQLVVGFLVEPAFAGTVNGVDLRVTDTRADPAKNVEGLETTVTADVFQGGLSTPLSLKLRARFGTPGAYAADFIPTRAGSYRFVFRGKIEDTAIAEKDGTFESGPGRFNDAEDPSKLQYPAKVPEGADLSERLDAIDRQLGSIQALAIVAIVLAIVLPIGNAVRARRRT
jgi:hypothetical protein